ncbi:dystonin-like [Carassius carassius]|uniref:dystonin-like n=1 Tax=Carassius carassius TaxID=217509 RepID=UPI002868ABC1|nr:dystonin-like [Carassius carassius]
MIAAAFLVLLRPLSIQCVLLLLLLLVGTVATILFLSCWHRKLRNEKIPLKSVFTRRSRSRAGFRPHHFRSEVCRHSPRLARRSARARVSEEQPLIESEPDSNLRKRRGKKRVQPDFYQSVQLTPTPKPSSGSGNASLRCSMSSSADFSDDEEYSVKSGSVSPAPGDTLPWNLPRHERSKRKIQGGSVLDPAERAVLRIADERDRVQKKTFTKWVNQHLLKVRKHVNDLYEDLRDGHNLISLLEVLSGDTLPRERDFLKTLRLVSEAEACTVERHGRDHDDDDDEDKGPREKGRMRFHRLQNVQIALDYLKRRQVKLVNIRNDDITDGNPKLTLGLIWTIILHFQISDIHVTGESEDMTAKERLLLWSKQMTEGYVGVRCDNFTTSWRDGRLFSAIIHKYRPDLVDMSRVSTQSSRSNLEQAFGVAEQLGVARLLDPEDVDVSSPDEKSVITYVSTLYDVFPKVPEGMEGISANDVDIKWVEYQNMVKYLSQWIKHNVTVMSDRNFPRNPVELKALYTQYLQFKENEIPPKENEKAKIKHLYKMLEVWIEFGRIQLPQGYHPNDVEKEWGKLIVAMLEREKSLRPEVDRLEMLQQIANRVQRDSVAGEDKLLLARTALQSDAKRLESGIQFQNEAEIAGYLLECENLLRQQVVDIQLLLDGKFYLADQLVQRVSKLRDDLLALRTECSTVYSKGHMLTSEQTKMMISGITQSLNSNLSPNFSAGLSPELSDGGLVTSGGSPAMSPAMTPSMTPAAVQTYLSGRGGGGGMGPGVLQQLKHMQIRKPMLKSSFLDPSLTKDEVHMKFVQDLINWVEEMQVQLDQAEWGSDLSSVESNLGNHKDFHKAIEEFQMSIKEANMSEMTQPLKQSYSEKLKKLESQYGRLLKCSGERQKHLDSLYDFVSHATQELIWLNEKEEEEVAFDWSERNSNISRKRDYHADLMRELDDKEQVIKSVQEKAESLLLENHPARLTIEAYRAAMQTQWSWILQLCHCVEQHLKENAVYFDFFSGAKESLDYLKSLQDAIHRKYSCDRSSSLHRLEDLIQESMDEKEQLLKYSSTVGGLVGRTKSVVQLKARNPDNPIRTSIPVKAICDYRQIEITITKEDECVLVSNSHRAKWKVISPSGNEAMVPSVCFSVPPPNKEATEMASKIEQLYQKVLALWHHSHINMKSVVSWHYLMTDIRTIRKSTVASIKTLLPGDHEQVLSSLQSHFEDFLRDSDESEVFTVADCAQLEKEVLACNEYYEELLKSAEREEHEESMYNLFISEVRNFRMRVEGHEEQLIRKIRTPLDRDDLQECVLRITEQEKNKVELDRLKDDLESLSEKCEVFLRQAAASPSVPALSSELNILTQSMNQVYSMCCIYLEKLKTVSLVVKHSQSAEALLKLYESKLCEEDTTNANIKSIDGVMSTLKQWRSEIDERREIFHDLEDELQKARVVSERMFKTHNERDFDLDWHKEKADQLKERWQNIQSQIENRLRDLESISKSLKYYKDTYNSLDEWSKEMEAKQLKTQENQPEDSKALAEFLNQQKVLVAEIEQKLSKFEECQKYSEQYAVGVKDYELQLMTYRAMVDSQQKSPVKRRKMQSSSDVIQQEFMDLRTRYTALVTLMTQYVKFAGETLKRAEEDERSVEDEKKDHGNKVNKLLNWMSCMKTNLNKDGKAQSDGKPSTESTSKPQMSLEEMMTKKEQIGEALRTTQLMLTKHSDNMTEEEKQEAEEQLKSLRQAYSELSQQCADAAYSADQALQVLQGILDVESGAVMSVCCSVNNGLIDQNTGLGLLEAQLITTGLIWPEQHLYMDLEDAFKNKLVDDAMCKQLQELNEAKKCLQNLQFALEPLPVITALENGAISEQTAIKIIEIQLATGGLRPKYTGDILHLEKAFQLGLIPESLFIKILAKKDSWKNLIDPNTAEKCTLSQLMQRCIMHKLTGLRLLPVKRGKDGNISLTSGREISIMKAMHEGIIDRETMCRLVSTQLFAGGIVDPKTGRKVTVEEALFEGLIDQDTASETLSHQAQNGGIVNPCNRSRLTVDEAVQCDLISSSTALLVLERQKAFMGLLWPNAGEILSFSTSLQQNIITDKLASELLRNRHKITALYIPETSEVVDIDSAEEDNLIETFTKELLKKIEIPDVFPDIDELNNRFSSWLVMKELQIDGSCSIGEEISDENSTDAPSLSEAKQLFISYLMMNSYLDPKSGQRLLIFDWQLNKMAKLLFTETSESEHVVELSGLYMKVSEESQLNNNISDNDNACLNADYSALGELQICEPLESTTEKGHGVVNSTALHNCPKPTLQSEFVINTIETNRRCDILLDCVKHVTLIEANKLSKDSTCSNTDKCQAETSNIASSQPSEEMQLPQITFSVEATTSSLCSMEVHPDCHETNKDQEKHSKDSTLLSSETISYTEMSSEFPHTEVVWDDKLERDYSIHLLRAQLEEGGILDVTSGKRYELEAALGKGLIDEEIILEVLAPQLQEDGLNENKNATLSVLNISVSKGCISSKVALQIMEKQNLLGGFLDAAAGKTISVCDALETSLITDDLSRSILSAEEIRKAIIDHDGKCVLSVNNAHQSGMLDDEEAERIHSQQDERGDIMVPDLAKRGQISLRSDEATQVPTDIACVSSSQGSLLLTITDTLSKGISTKDNVFEKVSETNGIVEDCDKQYASFKTIDSKNHIDTTDERERGFPLEGNETERPHNSVDTFDVDDSCKTVSLSPCVRQMAYLETTASQVVSPVQSDSGISCSSQSDICSEESKSECVPNPEQEFDRSKVESEKNAYFYKRPYEGLSASLPMIEDLAQIRTPVDSQSNSSLCCASATIAKVNLSTDEPHTLAQNILNEKEEVSSQTNASNKAKYSNNVRENLDDEHSVEDSGVFSSENRVKDMVKYENRNAPETEVEPSAVCAESSIDLEKNVENSVGFKGSDGKCQLDLMDLVGSTGNSEQLPLEVVTNSSQGDSSGGNHNMHYPSKQGLFYYNVAPKTTTKDELTRSSESDFTSDNDTQVKDLEMLVSSSGHCSQDIIAEFNDMQSAAQIPSPSVKLMHDQNSEQSGNIFNQSQAGDTVVAECVHQDDLHLSHMAMAEDESLPKSIGGSDLKSFSNELIQMKMDGASMDETQKQKCQAIDSIVEIIQHHSGISPTNHASSNERSGDPDILLDLKKHEEPREAQNWPSDESNDEPKHQTDLLEMIHGISTDRDKGMLEEVDGKPSSPLGDTALSKEGMEAKIIPVPTTDDAAADDIFQPTESNHLLSMAEDPYIQQTDRVKARRYSTQNYLECVGRLQDHCDTLEDIRSDLQTKGLLAEDIEGLHCQLKEVQSLEAQIAALPDLLTADLSVADQLLNSADENVPTQIHQDLATVYVDLQNAFTDVCHLSAERNNAILLAIETVKIHLETLYQDLLSSLEKVSAYMQDNSEMVSKLDIMDADNIGIIKNKIQQNTDIEKDLSGTRQLLEDAAFDIQNFISDHAQFLSPTHSRHLLRALSTTQRSFKELMDRVFTQRQTLEVQLEICEDEAQQQAAVEKQREFSEKLQELFDDLTQTENRLIGHQQQAASAKTVGDLQQYQQEHQALQKDLQANVSALNEVISSTEKFLEENRSKLTPEQISALEDKLEELKSKANMLNQKSEESRKDLEKVLSSAIKQVTEKEAAVEQLEESKTKIESLLGWISNIGKEKEMGGIQKDQMVKQNGNMPENTSMKGIIGEEDDPNGNALDTTDNTSLHVGEKQVGKDLDLDQQFNMVQARHQEILSQQQDLIIATRSAQVLLDKQAQVLSPAEKDKLQGDIKELKARYESSLTQAEQQMKQVQTVQEELQKFKGDCEEFETWLQQSHGHMEELGLPAVDLDTLSNNLQRQKSFSEDVISHKGDLRFITISGQKVLDTAKACDHGDSDGLPMVDMSGTCAAVKERLDSATSHYKALHTQCNQLGVNLKDVVDKYKKYEDASGALVKWLNVSEEESRRQQSEPIAGDPQTLQRQLEETKSLQGQTTSRQAAVDTLRKTADALISAEGDLLSHPEEIQETVDDIVERYDNLSKSVSDRNEKLQVTLTRSLSVQDGLDEMMSWMEKVEESVKEMPKVLLDSSSIADALSKEAALEQDMSSRQSSILAMKAKVKKFVGGAEPAAGALLQTKMEGLSQRFTDASERHKQKVAQMEELRDKVEQFEKTSEKVLQFVLKSSQALSESDGPGKNVTELSQLLQDTNAELAEHTKDMETLQKLTEELSKLGPEGSTALLQSKMQNISDSFNAFKETITDKKEEVSSCQKQLQEFRAAAGVLMKWLEETKEQVPELQPNCSEQGLGTDLQQITGLLDEWTIKAPAVQDINSQGSALCSLISVLTSPAKAKIHHNSGSAVSNGSGTGSHSYLTNQELMLVQQNMSSINNDYKHLGELLKARSSELSALLKRVQGVHDQAESLRQWMEDTKKTAASLSNHPSGKYAVKSQIEQQKVFEDNMKQKQVQLQQLRENLLSLIEEHPDSPEAEKWKHMLAQIDAGWEEVKGTLEIQKQHLEESSRMLELFQTTQPQLSQWLQEKELMMGVLGPLSVDPNMLNTQKQQVQILLKEFDSRKPQYEKLTEAATAIASASEQQDPTVELVKEQLASVSQKWQALTGQLSQRHALIEQVVSKTTKFQELLRSLSKSATCLETELNNQQALSTQPEEVKKQIEATNTILAQLREEKKRLKEAETVCSELSVMVTEEYLRADLTKQLEGITKPFRQLEDKAGKRIEQLNSAFASSQQFHQTSKDFQAWLNQTLQEQCTPQLISANAEKLKQSLKENSSVQKAISEHEEPYNTTVKEGEALLQSTEGAEKVALQGQLSALRSNWDDVKKNNAAQTEKLQGALQRAQKYKEHSENLSSWLQECEDREKKVKLSVSSVEIEGSLSQLKAIQKDVDKHRGQVVMMNTAADSLLEVVTSDGDSVREEMATIAKRVDKLTEDLTLKRESLENISQKLKEFNDLQKEAKGQLEAARKQLDSHSDLGVQAYSSKNFTNMKAQQNSLEGVHNQIGHLKNLAKSLVVDASEVEGVTDLLLQADSLEKDHMSISQKVEDACSTLENKLQGIGKFQNSIREMFANFTDLDDEFDGMAPVGRDLDTLWDQESTIKDFVARLQNLMTSTANGRDSCKKMLESEASPDLLGLKRDLETLDKQCGKLMDRATGRREEVKETLSHLEEFYSKTQEFTHKLSSAEEQEESQGSVGLETEVINQQLEDFKVFQRDVTESLQSQLQELNILGQALIQNATKGTNLIKLDQDLEEVNTRWNTLNKKVAERSAQLHEALLHCGRFQDALESLLSWLTDTEELVANQKPPSAEFKVVKAQIQEQKLLQRLLDDRRATVELIKTEGRKVTNLADNFDKEKIMREIECLGQRWDDLLKKADNRQKQLENILVVAQQFHETLEPWTEWLTATEKRLANSEPIGTQTSKLEEQISQHKALEEEVLGRGKILYQAMSLGQSLRTVSCVDDKELVQAKLDTMHSSYIELQEHYRQKAELLRQALANAQLFGEDEVALMTWLDEVHGKLSEVSIRDYTTAVLAKHHAEQLALHEDIGLRKQNIEQAILNGLELLKQTTGDEVVVIQGKLDGIKTRYSEINTMSNNVSKTLDKALSLATKLQNTHKELISWLEKVESELAMFKAQEPVGEQLNCLQERQKTLMKEVKDQKPVVDSLNEVSSALLELVPWRAREGLDRMVTDDNERYRTASDVITQHVDQTGAAILKSQQFEQAATFELEWLTEAERKLSCLGDVRLEPEQTTAQLQAQKIFSMDIMRHKDAVDGIVKTGEAIMNNKDEAEKQALRVKLQALSEKYSVVSQLNSERCLQLERAHSLACQFWETHDELWPWLQETRTTFTQLAQPTIEYEALRQQQEELRQMRELIAEHKPHIDKMNKTGPQLVKLSPTEGAPIREKYEAADKLYSQLKVDVKHRAAALDEAISKSTQFHDKIDPMLESLERIAERLRQPPSISVEVEKIREQISENKAVNVDLEKLQPSYETLRQRGEEMISRSEGADNDLSAKAVQDKLDQMVFLWNDIQALLEEREAKLLDVMDLAEKFWCDHCALIITIKDTHDLLKELEEPGVDPSVVKQQQESVEGFREEIEGLQEELTVVQNLGAELMTACGEPDKPVIKKSIDEVNSAWETLNKAWKERVESLEEAMQAAVQFQDSLQNMFDSVDIMEGKLDSMSPVGTDLETVKQQIEELKEFKGDTYQLQIEMERLNHQAGLLLKKVLEEAERSSILEPMNELKMLWDNLDKKIINRQHKLEGALLALGQFQHALDELLAWLTHTEELLGEQRKACGDPKAIEIELAKHHVLQNDVLAHKTTVEAVNKAGSDLIDSSAGEEAQGLHNKLENLNQRWRTVLEKTEQRRQLLDSALLQAQGFHGEIEDMHHWLKDTERQLLASKALGGLPDTAREQLNTHLELCSTLEAKEEIYKHLLDRGQHILTLTPEGQDSTTELDLHNLQEKWECVQAKVTERKVKLEEALALATDFHNSLQDFINWLTQAEQTLATASPASLILETIMFQVDEHKVFVTEVNSHRDQIIELDKTGTHLKYFSQKQDVVLIKNLLLSVQGRWEKVVQRSVERGRLLDDARKRARQFHESWNKLMEWLEESERALDSELEIANDPDKIKTQLTQHKEFQKALGSKHSVYDTSSRTGRALKDKTSLKDDNQKLDDMLSELRDKWDTVCGKSVERQNKLEEALLFSGQFTDALQALIDWLYKVEPQLAEDQPVHGDIDLILNLIDSHKVFQKELGKRTGSVQALKRSARELTDSSHDDSSWVKVQMQELSMRWETVCSLSVSKQTRLEQALCQAEEFHSSVHILLEWLAEAEQSLRFHGALPDDEEALHALIEQHKEFMKKLEEKRLALNKATSMGEAILSICHPDSITTIKHWNTIIKARFEEVTAWVRQHQQRLSSALAELLATQELLENLLNWLQWAETTLGEKDKEPLPQELEEVKTLIAEHQTFMEEMTRKQPDVDKITKTHKRKATADPPIQSQIPVLGKGRTPRKRSPTQSMYTAASQAQIETKNPRVNLLFSKWQQVWLLALDRRRKLNDALDRLEELKEFANFDFDVWRKRYMRWMNHKKSRVMDFFRRIDKDQDGKVTRQEFIDGILSSRFPTSRLEMSAVADIFDRDGDGYIDYYEFVAALHPNKDAYKPLTDADKIEDEVTRQVAKCKCPKRFQVEQIGANKYRFYLGNQFGLVRCLHDPLIADENITNRDNQNLTPHLHVAVLESCILFGDSQQLRLVRILRSTVMVRVGGGWMALDEFLVKNDPCRVHHHGSKMLRSESNSSITQSPIGWQLSHFLSLLHPSAKGRTNVELREKFILPEGTTQVMASFRYRGRRSRPSSRGASPNRSNSSHNCPAQPNPPGSNTPKTLQHLSRNYDKPWLTNSKSATPLKSSDSFESQGSSNESTPIQGSKLRLPGYLSGKGFQSGEDGSLINTAVMKARGQAMGLSKIPGSKAGSRGSSRRGSDASDFDISDIQSVYSDMSETVTDSGRPTPRSASRQHGGKPSKIPTPQRRSTPTSKLAKTTKR